MPYQTVNPLNGEVVRTFDQHTDRQMEQMLANADKTFREIWSKKPVRDRAKIVGKAASLMLEQKEKFARLATLEMGKRIVESQGEVELSASILKYYATTLKSFSHLVPWTQSRARPTLSIRPSECWSVYNPGIIRIINWPVSPPRIWRPETSC
jgi:acyl-CoA reductase-like NAD-dependent aldehyde dehydrogenase